MCIIFILYKKSLDTFRVVIPYKKILYTGNPRSISDEDTEQIDMDREVLHRLAIFAKTIEILITEDL